MAALLEVLDPAQNVNFADHYLECEYDLSKVMFVMTANDIGRIPGPLRDRMEMIHIPGYTPDEKLQISKRYLLERAIESHGLQDYPVNVSDKIMMRIIRGYTKEAGVRNLQRHMNTIARKIATDVVTSDAAKGKKYKVTDKSVEKYLGPQPFESTAIEETPQIGLVNGLAWTSVGGELLNIEVITMPGTGKIQVTGKLGEVMQESAKAALSWVRSLSDFINVDHDWYNKHDIHVHVPEGATPKDGPSAGITMATALTSAIAGIPVRQNVAMTGEITLRGRVLPIGGLKEKLLAAKQAGITTVVIPAKNAKDLVKVPNEIKNGLSIHPVAHADDVLKLALDLEQHQEFLVGRNFTIVEGEQASGLAQAVVAN